VPTSGGQPPYRAGVIGYGLAGEVFHAPLIAATPGLELAAIVTSNAGRQAEASRRYPRAQVVPDTAQLFGLSALDVVVVASPNRTHVPLAIEALDAGFHVVVDKPLAAGAADAARVIATARARGRLLTVFQNRRWDGDFLTLRRLVQDGRLGRVFRFESHFDRWRPEVKPGWRMSDAPEQAGGLLFDLGSHLIDQALVLFGPATRVYAELDRRRPGVSVDDDSFLALTHASGVMSHLWMGALVAQLAPRFRVLGDRAGYTKFGSTCRRSGSAAARTHQSPAGATKRRTDGDDSGPTRKASPSGRSRALTPSSTASSWSRSGPAVRCRSIRKTRLRR